MTAVSMLEGPLPSGEECHIILGLRESVSADRLKIIFNRAEKDRATLEQNGGSLTIRDLGEARMIDRRQMLIASRPPLALPTDALPTTEPTTLPIEASIDWRIQLFVPAGIKYSQYELNLMDLRAGGFAKDEAFLRALLNTLKYADRPPPM